MTCYLPRSKGTLKGVLDVNDVEAADVLLTMRDHTTTAPVTPTSDEREVASIELDKVGDLALLEIEADGVVDLD